MSAQRCSELSRTTDDWFTGTVLFSHRDAYVAWLTSRGYARGTVDYYLRAVAHFAHWSAHRVRTLAEIDEPLMRRFVDAHLPSCRCARHCVRTRTMARAALRQLLAWLRSQGQLSPPPPRTPPEIATELEAFEHHLTSVRGLREVTRQFQLKHVRALLLAHLADGTVELAALTPCDIGRFVHQHTAGWKPASIRQVCVALRSYLRFKAGQGINTTPLVAALPRIAQWRLSGLPRALSPQEVKQLLGAFDRRTATGRRDFAIARCYLDLGLRTAEVTRLQLDDIDWSAGQVRIRGKGQRINVLPLPMSTGRAITAYLRHGRAHSASRALFLRYRPPCSKPATTETMRGAIRNAARRCGLAQRVTGTHILRHTVAQRLVDQGVSFKAIADLLRHRNLDTTTIYAKVDLTALTTVAAPWPGSQS
ncbi:MAG: tyrosine-type recombinase/integrase [Gammaproteobacteria bacterium]|nr:tyrosine-type recombinase/integrase [Gammaproteobacteria bacterium]